MKSEGNRGSQIFSVIFFFLYKAFYHIILVAFSSNFLFLSPSAGARGPLLFFLLFSSFSAISLIIRRPDPALGDGGGQGPFIIFFFLG